MKTKSKKFEAIHLYLAFVAGMGWMQFIIMVGEALR